VRIVKWIVFLCLSLFVGRLAFANDAAAQAKEQGGATRRPSSHGSQPAKVSAAGDRAKSM